MCITCYRCIASLRRGELIQDLRQWIRDYIGGLALLLWGVAMLLHGLVDLCKACCVKAYRWVSRAESVEHGESESEMNDINAGDALAIDCEDLPSLLGEDFAPSDV